MGVTGFPRTPRWTKGRRGVRKGKGREKIMEREEGGGEGRREGSAWRQQERSQLQLRVQYGISEHRSKFWQDNWSWDFRPVLRHWWLGDRKSIRSIKSWVLVVGGDDRFDWSFARLIAPVVTSTSIILSSNNIQKGDIRVPPNPGPSRKTAVTTERENWSWEAVFFWLDHPSSPNTCEVTEWAVHSGSELVEVYFSTMCVCVCARMSVPTCVLRLDSCQAVVKRCFYLGQNVSHRTHSFSDEIHQSTTISRSMYKTLAVIEQVFMLQSESEINNTVCCGNSRFSLVIRAFRGICGSSPEILRAYSRTTTVPLLAIFCWNYCEYDNCKLQIIGNFSKSTYLSLLLTRSQMLRSSWRRSSSPSTVTEISGGSA